MIWDFRAFELLRFRVFFYFGIFECRDFWSFEIFQISGLLEFPSLWTFGLWDFLDFRTFLTAGNFLNYLVCFKLPDNSDFGMLRFLDFFQFRISLVQK